MNNLLIQRVGKVLAFLLGLVGASAFAQVDTVPNKPIRIITGFPPGSNPDVVARVLAEHIGTALGRAAIVEARPGRGSILSLSVIAKAPPDGTTLGIGVTAGLAINPNLYRNLTYDPVKDFTPVGMVADGPFVLVANPKLPVRSIAELLAYARADPGKLTYSSSGNGTLSHIAMEDFKRRTGISVLHVPYQGSVSPFTDMIAGRVDFGWATAGETRSFVESGRLKMLAVASAVRYPQFPVMPTVAESGLPGFEVIGWLGLVAPTGLDKGIVARLNMALNSALKSSEIAEKLSPLGLDARPGSPDAFGAFVRAEFEKWGQAIRASGIKLD